MRQLTTLVLLWGTTLAAATASLSLEPGLASRITLAKQQIERSPGQPDGHTALALALVKAARATDRSEYLTEAEQAVADALRIAPDDFEAHKAEVAIRLAQHRYQDALAEAKALNKKVPDDNLMNGFIADSQFALGDYAAAEKATQWMIDQRAVNAPGFERGAALREVFGYNEPALEWWNSAMRITSAADAEERAWILTNMSRVELRMGHAADGEKHARQSLELVADYPPASDALAAALLDQDHADQAADVLKRRLAAAPNVRAEFLLATALDTAAAWQQFEKDASARISLPDNANRELIEYYATHNQSAAAVKLAAEESQRRHDVGTLAVYAVALASAGRYEEARDQMDRALAPGIRDARLFFRAGAIAAQLYDTKGAATYLKKTIEINSSSKEAEKAIQLLANLSQTAQRP